MITFPPDDLSHGCFGENDDSRHGWTNIRQKNLLKRKTTHDLRSEADILQSMKRSPNVMKGFNVEVAPPRTFMPYKMNVQKPTEARTVPRKNEFKRQTGKNTNKTSKPAENLDLLIAGFKANDELLLKGLANLRHCNNAWRRSVLDLGSLLSAKKRFHNKLVERNMNQVPHQRRPHAREVYLKAYEHAKNSVSNRQAFPKLPCELNLRVLQYLGANDGEFEAIENFLLQQYFDKDQLLVKQKIQQAARACQESKTLATEPRGPTLKSLFMERYFTPHQANRTWYDRKEHAFAAELRDFDPFSPNASAQPTLITPDSDNCNQAFFEANDDDDLISFEPYEESAFLPSSFRAHRSRVQETLRQSQAETNNNNFLNSPGTNDQSFSDFSTAIGPVLENFNDLDENGQNQLLLSAFASKDIAFIQQVSKLKKNANELALLPRLVKNLVTDAKKLEITNLKYDQEPGKRRYYFNVWLQKIRDVLQMYKQTQGIIIGTKIIPSDKPASAGNQAVYHLLLPKSTTTIGPRFLRKAMA